MTEHHAISRRAFTLGLGLAALSPFVSLPETAGLGLPVRAAFADDAATASANLNNFVIRLRPAGYFRTASVNEDGNVIGNVCHLFNDGTSSKLILEHVGTDAAQTGMPSAPCSISKSTRRRATAFGRSMATRTKMERSSTYGVASTTIRTAAPIRSTASSTELILFETAYTRKTALTTWP